MNRRLLLTVYLLILCISLVGCYAGLSKDGIFSLALSGRQEIERAILNGTVAAEWEGRRGILRVRTGEDGCVEFFCARAGAGLNGCYFGFYYSPDDQPHDALGLSGPFAPEGNGWAWRHPYGGNGSFYTERIAERFFYYEYHS